MHVLVTCASPHGSTRGIAQRIATRLREHAFEVDCAPVEDVDAVTGYDAVVVGSAIHDQAWLPEASAFLSEHATDLRSRSVWLFSVGMPGALPRPLRTAAMREGPQVVAPFTTMVRPRGTRLFSGVVDRRHFPRAGAVALTLMGAHEGDFRRWPEIDAWAAEIAAALQEAQAAPGPAPGE